MSTDKKTNSTFLKEFTKLRVFKQQGNFLQNTIKTTVLEKVIGLG